MPKLLTNEQREQSVLRRRELSKNYSRIRYQKLREERIARGEIIKRGRPRIFATDEERIRHHRELEKLRYHEAVNRLSEHSQLIS